VAADKVTQTGTAAGNITIPALPVAAEDSGADSGTTESGTDGGDASGGTDTGTGTKSTESSSTETDTGTDTGTSGGSTSEAVIEVTLPVSIETDGQAVVTATYEFNDTKLTMPVPVETWHSGKHVLTLYYPIEDVVANYTNTFNVYLRMTGGTGKIETGDIIASVSGQSMAAKEAWDGKIEIEDTIKVFKLSGLAKPAAFTETVETDIKWVVNYYWGDTIGTIKVGAFGAITETGGTE